MEWRSEKRKRKRKGQKILVDVVEAEIERRDITLAADEMVCCLLFVCSSGLDPFTWYIRSGVDTTVYLKMVTTTTR